MLARLVLRGRRHEQRETAFKIMLVEIRTRQAIAALGGSHPAPGDERRKPAVALPVGCEQDELQSVLEPDFGTDDEFQSAIARRFVGTHHTGKRAFVRYGERGIAELVRVHDELLGMSGAAQEREVGNTVQLGVFGSSLHPKIPCRYHAAGAACSR